MANELIGREYVVTTLKADGTLTALASVYAQEDVPDDVTLPYVVVRELAAFDTQGASGTIYMNRPRFLVAAINADSNFESIETLAERIHTNLHKPTATAVSRGNVHGAIREPNGIHRSLYEINGVQYVEMGGIYMIFTDGD